MPFDPLQLPPLSIKKGREVKRAEIRVPLLDEPTKHFEPVDPRFFLDLLLATLLRVFQVLPHRHEAGSARLDVQRVIKGIASLHINTIPSVPGEEEVAWLLTPLGRVGLRLGVQGKLELLLTPATAPELRRDQLLRQLGGVAPVRVAEVVEVGLVGVDSGTPPDVEVRGGGQGPFLQEREGGPGAGEVGLVGVAGRVEGGAAEVVGVGAEGEAGGLLAL